MNMPKNAKSESYRTIWNGTLASRWVPCGLWTLSSLWTRHEKLAGWLEQYPVLEKMSPDVCGKEDDSLLKRKGVFP